MVYGLTKFKMFNVHTDVAASNSIHCVHICSDIFKTDDASQKVNVLIKNENPNICGTGG